MLAIIYTADALSRQILFQMHFCPPLTGVNLILANIADPGPEAIKLFILNSAE